MNNDVEEQIKDIAAQIGKLGDEIFRRERDIKVLTHLKTARAALKEVIDNSFIVDKNSTLDDISDVSTLHIVLLMFGLLYKQHRDKGKEWNYRLLTNSTIEQSLELFHSNGLICTISSKTGDFPMLSVYKYKSGDRNKMISDNFLINSFEDIRRHLVFLDTLVN